MRGSHESSDSGSSRDLQVLLLTCMSLVVFQHVDLLGKLAVAFFTLVLFDALVKLHVVPQSVLGLHA